MTNEVMSTDDRVSYVRRYFERLTAADYLAIIDMFDQDGEIDSPYLGKMRASDFFTKLGKASQDNKLTVFDVLLGENGNSAAAHFEYDWTLGNGDKIIFQGIDYFRFAPSGKFASMSIFYDTHPTRQDVGDKYANA